MCVQQTDTNKSKEAYRGTENPLKTYTFCAPDRRNAYKVKQIKSLIWMKQSRSEMWDRFYNSIIFFKVFFLPVSFRVCLCREVSPSKGPLSFCFYICILLLMHFLTSVPALSSPWSWCEIWSGTSLLAALLLWQQASCKAELTPELSGHNLFISFLSALTLCLHTMCLFPHLWITAPSVTKYRKVNKVRREMVGILGSDPTATYF